MSLPAADVRKDFAELILWVDQEGSQIRILQGETVVAVLVSTRIYDKLLRAASHSLPF
jgi:hypothetical protein